MSAETVCCGWVVVAVLVLWLFHIRSKSMKRLIIHYPIARRGISCVVAPSCHKAGCVSATSLPLAQEKVLFCTLQVMSFLLIVIRARLIMSGDVELNPGPLDQG